MPDRLTIGELAEAAGVPTTTVRFYERRGLILPEGPAQNPANLLLPASRDGFMRPAPERLAPPLRTAL